MILTTGTRLALGDVDHDGIGKDAVNGRILHPGIVLETLLDALGIETQQRRVIGHGGNARNLLARKMSRTVDLHVVDMEEVGAIDEDASEDDEEDDRDNNGDAGDIA